MSDIRNYFSQEDQKERKCSTCSKVVSQLVNSQCEACVWACPTGKNIRNIPCGADRCYRPARYVFYDQDFCEEHMYCIKCEPWMYEMYEDGTKRTGFLCKIHDQPVTPSKIPCGVDVCDKMAKYSFHFNILFCEKHMPCEQCMGYLYDCPLVTKYGHLCETCKGLHDTT
jgi:hypothetical protein